MNNINDAAGQPDGLENITNLLHEKRGLRRWFVDEGIADSDGVWDKPGKDQGREIEGSYPPEYSERFLDNPAVDIGWRSPWRFSPCNRMGTEQAVSMISMIRRISPRASLICFA